MIEIVNAKINIGLQIVRRREDGYHDLQTLFYPVGKYAGTCANPTEFCDILELTIDESCYSDTEFIFTGRPIDCELEKNLVYKAVTQFEKRGLLPTGLKLRLDKHLPDGAGLGGGSADASCTLRLINSLSGNKLSDKELAGMALELGADCPFFIYNRPMYATGVGEKLEEVELSLDGFWIVIAKPKVYISTREAFAGVVPHPGNVDLRELSNIPIAKWQEIVVNDFEESVFPKHRELKELKQYLIDCGSVYASMTGSGSSIYGIVEDYAIGERITANLRNNPTIEGVYLLKL